ncbi:MAG: phosphoribosylanthranilate isomerase [Candidatus Omnitrophica bacterium]|nr:phosphoribosylanthranilate isomerase [Candidatus Omnitrophota bacterium]
MVHTRVKICGITNTEDALKASFYGAWAVGFVFHKKSPRYVSPSKARKIIESLPPFITPVGVFVDLNERAVRDICQFTRIRCVQFHGREDQVYCKRFGDYKIIKAFRVDDAFNVETVKKYKVDAYLFDAFVDGIQGGTGQTFNWNIIKGVSFDKPVILSGGLSAANIREAIETLHPYAVDVSSSLEQTAGIKNPKLIKEFFDEINKILLESQQKPGDVLK